MGVPYCFAWLRKQKKIALLHKGNEIGDFHILYFDWNCLLHPECFKVLFANIDLTDQKKLEDKMFKRIIAYTNYVIRFVSPKNYVYFAIDGVAPLAKIRQQRQRRFGYAHDYRKEIMDKYGIKYNDSWSNVVITPGTEFMDRLHSRIRHYYSSEHNRKEYCSVNSQLKIIYSSYHVPGEGEHKILQDIKSRFSKNNKENIAIYGLDADLIFLSMASERSNIYLVREEGEFNKKIKSNEDPDDVSETLVYVDMDETMECINETFRKGISDYMTSGEGFDDDDDMDSYYNDYNDERLNSVSFVNDYILICYLLGNDFLPHFPSIDLRREGMELVISKYIEVFCNYDYTSIVTKEKDGIEFNNDMFHDFISALASDEYSFFVDKLRMFMEREKKYAKCFDNDEYKIEIWKVENLIGEKIEDNVMLGIGEENEWKYRYYANMGSEEHQEEFIEGLCKNYLEGIVWSAKYYLDKCQDWRWQYEYTHPPLISDLNNYMHKLKKEKELDLNSFNFNNNKPLPMFVQLLSVLPPKFNYLLPVNYRSLTTSHLSPIIDMYPTKYNVDKLYKSKLYQCVPLIPNLNIDRVLEATKDMSLSSNEERLSKIKDSSVNLF